MASASVFFMGAGALHALLPRFLVDELGATEALTGTIMGSMALSALMTRVWFGRLADRRGGRLVFCLGAVVSTTALFVLLVEPSIAGAFLARLIIGAGNAAVMTSSAMMAIEMAPENRRGEAASYAFISFHIGMGLGPVVGAWLLERQTYPLLWCLIALVMASSILLAMLLPYRPGDSTSKPAPLVHRNAIIPGLVTLFGVFAFNGFSMFVPLYSREVGLENFAVAFTLTSFTIIGARVVLGRVPDRIGSVAAGSRALVATFLATLVLAFWTAPAGIYAGAVLLALGLSLQSPSFLPLAVAGVPDRERGAAMATYTGFFDLANAVIGPTFGAIVGGFGYQTAFLSAGAMSLVALAILRISFPRGRTAV